MTMSPPTPTRAEEVALFRLGIIGDLLSRELHTGELQEALKEKAQQRYRPPGASVSRAYHFKTLQGWYYAAKSGFENLKPASRVRGHALILDDAQRALLLDMRREHPTAAADLILAEAVRNGILPKGAVSVESVRRLFRDADASREGLNRARRRQQRRWQADRACAIWHADVCHLWLRDRDNRPHKVYIHGILDDCTRYVPAIEARGSEREVDLLSVLCGALLRFPATAVLYVDNGSCYRGEVLALAGERLGIRVVHAQPYDPEARGKMERFWRTMRQRCTDHLPTDATLHDVNAALLAWVDEEYHRRPHAGLLGETPLRKFQAGLVGQPEPLTARRLADALVVTVHPTIRQDATFQLNGRTYEITGRHLAGRRIDVLVDPFTDEPIRASLQGQAVVFGLCDPVANAHRGRPGPSDTPKTLSSRRSARILLFPRHHEDSFSGVSTWIHPPRHLPRCIHVDTPATMLSREVPAPARGSGPAPHHQPIREPCLSFDFSKLEVSPLDCAVRGLASSAPVRSTMGTIPPPSSSTSTRTYGSASRAVAEVAMSWKSFGR